MKDTLTPEATGDSTEASARAELPSIVGGRRRWMLAKLVGNGVMQAAAATVTVLLIEAGFNRLVAGGSAASPGVVAALGAGLVTAVALGAWLRARERLDAERLGQSYTHALRLRMYRRLSALAPRALQSRSQGAVMLRFVGDLNAIRQWVSLGLARLIVAGTFGVGALAALAFISPRLGVGVGLVVLLGLASGLVAARPLRPRARDAQRHRARLAGNVDEKVASIGVVQVFGQTGREHKRVRRQSRALRDAMVARARVIGRLRGVAEATAGLATVVVLLVGALEVAAGRASAGTVVAAMAIVGLLVQPLRDLGRVQEYWSASRVSMEQVKSFMQTPSLLRERSGAPQLEPGPGRLEFDEVHLAGSLHGISATAEPGTIVAVVGPNGAGKSSLLALAARLVDPDTGAVRLDGQELAAHDLPSVRRSLSMVGPDLPLLRGSVERNLRYRWPEAPDEEIERVRRICSIDELLAELPDGSSTRISEGGRNLSAGQRQRIALARALVGDPRVLLLDEADANLDAAARAIVNRVIREGRGRRTVLVVSHRAEVLEWADDVWRIEHGRRAEECAPAPASDLTNGTPRA